MSTESSKVLLRQWRIALFLSKGGYVATANIHEHLAAQDIQVDIRTIQRDLVMLEKVFPLECRKDSVPHSWRWQKMPEAQVTGLSISQALTLRLVEEELQDVMSPKLLKELQPLFMRARVVAGVGQSTEFLPAVFDHAISGIAASGAVRGVKAAVSGAVLPGFWMILGGLLNPSKQQSNVDLQASVQEMAGVLGGQGLSELLDELQGMVVG